MSITVYTISHIPLVSELSEDSLERIIREKELEREVILARLDDELFLLKTQKLYQPLFHVLIQELGQLIMDNDKREIFLAISAGEPISHVSVRYQLTYVQTITIYNSILEELGKNTARIATFRNRAMSLQFSRFDATDPTNTPIISLFETHAYYVLHGEAGISTVRELLQYYLTIRMEQIEEPAGHGYNYVCSYYRYAVQCQFHSSS